MLPDLFFYQGYWPPWDSRASCSIGIWGPEGDLEIDPATVLRWLVEAAE